MVKLHFPAIEAGDESVHFFWGDEPLAIRRGPLAGFVRLRDESHDTSARQEDFPRGGSAVKDTRIQQGRAPRHLAEEGGIFRAATEETEADGEREALAEIEFCHLNPMSGVALIAGRAEDTGRDGEIHGQRLGGSGLTKGEKKGRNSKDAAKRFHKICH